VDKNNSKMNIQYVVGDATAPTGPRPAIIAHIVNNRGVWGAGFVLALSAKNKIPEDQYRVWFRDGVAGNPFKLGNILISPFYPDLFVAHLCAQDGFGEDGYPPIRYTWLCNCLIKLQRAAGSVYSVHMPRIGCGLGGGHWSRVGPIVQYFLCDKGVPVTVYDLPKTSP
jgi:O-acetyl-ADP-ribose deacetylase (regulator of RNase III)